jgi:hypothetical protein
VWVLNRIDDGIPASALNWQKATVKASKTVNRAIEEDRRLEDSKEGLEGRQVDEGDEI